eukprot:scaffold467_cov403-Prasinococcus_capsulatus_cf.AAC.16
MGVALCQLWTATIATKQTYRPSVANTLGEAPQESRLYRVHAKHARKQAAVRCRLEQPAAFVLFRASAAQHVRAL